MIANRSSGGEVEPSSQDPMDLDVDTLSRENQKHRIRVSDAYVALSHSYQSEGSKKKKKRIKEQIERLGAFLHPKQ